jgi:hypothetical protein
MRTPILAFLLTFSLALTKSRAGDISGLCSVDSRNIQPLALQVCHAEHIDTLWKASIVTIAGAKVADIASSWGKREMNPIPGRGAFGGRQTAISGGITAGVVGMEFLVVKRCPKAARVFRWVNFGAAGVVSAVAVHNYQLR